MTKPDTAPLPKKNPLHRLKRAFTLWQDNNPTGWLTKAYVLAFLLIGTLTLLSHNIMSHLTARQIEGKEVSYFLGQQVGLVREIGHYATSYYQNSEEYDAYSFRRSVEKIHVAQDRISAYLDNAEYSNEAKDTLRKIFREDPFNLDKKFVKYFDLADEYIAYSADSKTLDRKVALDEMRRYSEETFPKLLDMALTDYQSVQIREMQDLYRIEGYAAATIILVIILEALFIFRPLVKNVDKYHRTILRQALEDPLTRLNNRRAFLRDVSLYRKTAARGRQKFVIAVCDLDKFKHINDTYGHDTGDLVLRHFSKILKKSLRPSDIVARMGGEEFAIILTNTPADRAAMVLERIRVNTEKFPCPFGSPDNPKQLAFTTSIGFVQGSNDESETIETALKYADEALYTAKEQGRNLVREYKRPYTPSDDEEGTPDNVSSIEVAKQMREKAS
jgi:diguanylate cyclase (GGDEF)-like protein